MLGASFLGAVQGAWVVLAKRASAVEVGLDIRSMGVT